jgi:hypothetical protein
MSTATMAACSSLWITSRQQLLLSSTLSDHRPSSLSPSVAFLSACFPIAAGAGGVLFFCHSPITTMAMLASPLAPAIGCSFFALLHVVLVSHLLVVATVRRGVAALRVRRRLLVPVFCGFPALGLLLF